MNQDHVSPLVEGIPLLTLSEEGAPPRHRLTKASALRAIHMRYREDDDVSAQNRALVQDLLDGGQPYDQAMLNAAGQQGTTNLDFGGAEQTLERSMSPYYSMVSSTELLATVSTLYGEEDAREEWNAIMAEEITRTIRESEWFTYQTAELARRFVWDGIGVGYWVDDIDWRYRAAGLGKFYFPRRAKATESENECVTVVEEYTVTRLWNTIQHPETATENGWNVRAVRNAILNATTADPAYQDWERLSEEIKNNDLQVANNTPVVRLIIGIVKEFNDTVSIYITTEDPCRGNTEEFLYVGKGTYRSNSDAYVVFAYGLGTNGLLHGVRGLGKKIYAFEQQRNRSLSRLIDQGNLASSLMLQAPDEESLANVGLQYYGNTAVVDPNVKVVPYAAPDLQRTVMPVLETMERLRNDRVGSYSSEGTFDGDQRKTKFEISAKLQQDAVLSDTALDFWFGPFGRLIRGTIRRMSWRNYTAQDPGGREIMDLHLRLVKRGVPLEAFFRLDHGATRVVKAIGAGSASAQTLALARISELRPRMDDVAQAKLDRALAINAVGAANANIFFPADGIKRTTVDTNLALLENNDLLAGQFVPVLPSDRHLAHAREHIKPLLDGFTAVEEGQLPIEEGAMRMQLLFNHCAEHVDAVSGDPSAIEEAAMLRQMLQQVGEVISNGLKRAQEQANEGAAEGEAPTAGPDPKMIAEFEKHKAQMQMAQEEFRLKQQLRLQESEINNQIRQQDAATRRAIADADMAAKIARTRKEPAKPAKKPTK
jgi:hypothetical protein